MAGMRRRLATRWFVPVVAVVAVVALVAASCGAGPPTGSSKSAAAIQVVGPWKDVEAQRFERVLGQFEAQTGLRVVYTPAPAGVGVTLDHRQAAGQTTDLAFLPQPGLLRQYARAGRLVALDGRTAREVRANYSTVWQELGSVDGKLYGVWFKAADKSLIWYNISAFERAGAIPPTTLDGLVQLADRLRRAGTVPFAVGASATDAWTLTDWFENLYLTMQGSVRYQLLAQHLIPWTDSSVLQTLRMLNLLLQPGNVAGGTAGVLDTTFVGSVDETFASNDGPAMISEGDFVAGVITGTTRAQLGVDADAFRFPPEMPVSPWIIGGGDAAVLLSHSPAAQRLIRYLATPDAAAIWVSLGGFISPNLNVGLDRYADGITRSMALDVLDAGNSFLFDLSDLQPAAFGSTPGQGLFAALRDFLVHDDPAATAARLEAEATAAYSGHSG